MRESDRSSWRKRTKSLKSKAGRASKEDDTVVDPHTDEVGQLRDSIKRNEGGSASGSGSGPKGKGEMKRSKEREPKPSAPDDSASNTVTGDETSAGIEPTRFLSPRRHHQQRQEDRVDMVQSGESSNSNDTSGAIDLVAATATEEYHQGGGYHRQAGLTSDIMPLEGESSEENMVVDEEQYRHMFEAELEEINLIKLRVSKMLRKKAKEEKRRREAEKVYADLNKDQSLRKLAKVFGESTDSLPTGYGAGQSSSSSRDHAKLSNSNKKVSKAKEEKREKKYKRIMKKGKRDKDGPNIVKNHPNDTKAAETSGRQLLPSGEAGRRAWNTLSAREEQEKSWLREVMDERKKLAADKRRSTEATSASQPLTSPRLVNLSLSVLQISFLVL